MPRRAQRDQSTEPPNPLDILDILYSPANVSRRENERMKRQLSVAQSLFPERDGSEGPQDPDYDALPTQDGTAMRAELSGLKTIMAQGNQREIDDYVTTLSRHFASQKDVGLGLKCAIFRFKGDTLFEKGKYQDAVDMYVRGMKEIIGKDAVLPSPGYLNERYMALGEHAWRSFFDLMECAERISACYEKLEKPIELIDWVEECIIIYTNLRWARKPNEPSWVMYHINFIEWFSFRLKAEERVSNLFLSLGNTASASWSSLSAWTHTSHFKHPKLNELAKNLKWRELTRIYHPDFKQLHKLVITEPTLQVRGVWRKLKQHVAGSASSRPCGRSAHSSWVWNNHLYVAGGQTERKSELRDCWAFNLSDFTWKQLPDMPWIRRETGLDVSRNMRAWQDKAYWFTGSRKVWVLDLRTETWNSLQTKFDGRWPYREDVLKKYGSATLDGKLYIFGGDDEITNLGCNIFMALDLKTLVWEHLSGTSSISPSAFAPNLRIFTSMFAVPEQKKIYIVGGNASRNIAFQRHKSGGSDIDYTYNDMWSFDVPTKTWCRERRRGNFPPPRTEMAAVYNPQMGRAIMYGGYSQELMSAGTYITFFGDAYTFDPKTKIWQLVVAMGIPSYRALPMMASDPDTGRIYMSGGYTDTQYVPIKTELTRCFSDVWQLKLDMAGGDMTQKDLDIDWRTESIGPWKRCYSCANVGTEFKKCGGSCGGKWFFCSNECLRSGWKQHKESEGCRKI